MDDHMHACTLTEAAVKSNLVMVFGEITTNAKVDYAQTVKNTLQRIGYDDEENGALINT